MILNIKAFPLFSILKNSIISSKQSFTRFVRYYISKDRLLMKPTKARLVTNFSLYAALCRSLERQWARIYPLTAAIFADSLPQPIRYHVLLPPSCPTHPSTLDRWQRYCNKFLSSTCYVVTHYITEILFSKSLESTMYQNKFPNWNFFLMKIF